MVKNNFLLIAFFTALCCTVGNCFLENDRWLNIELHHAINPDNTKLFTFRGNITISSLNVGLANVHQNLLKRDEIDILKRLAANDDFYRLKATVIYSDGTQSSFLTSSKACALIASSLVDVLWVSIDTNGEVLGITETVSGNTECIKEENLNYPSDENLSEFNTDVLIKQTELAPVPDTTSFIQKLEREREARERGEVQDNRGFFAKYWMYIVPVALLVLISGATSPEANSGNGR